ncbi:Hemin receptor precursor [Pseudohaliea rubra DSM 19751]|uniref:Hemin receptor n=1 Tax=Pseudohaliea rubra DSM 19751 TaxID=1265313 RepID=A0A095VNQ2_9GAMM|nr:Hemin receptor precursor [Pseudohaliea rubra DSM 19751]
MRPSGYESRGVNLMTRHRLPGGGEWRLLAQHVAQPSTPRVDELVPGFGQLLPSSSLFEFSPNERSFLGLVLEPAVDRPWADHARLQLGWQRINDGRKTRDFSSPLLFTEQNRSDLYSASLVLAKRWTAGHRTRYGMDVTGDEVRSGRQLTVGARRPAAVAPRYPDGSELASAALFVTHSWSPRPATGIELGARYSRYRVDLAATAPAPGVRLEPDNLSLQFGLRQELVASLSLLANVSEGFRVPNIFDLGTLGPRPGNRFNAANPDLGPEQVLSTDLGLRWEGEDLRAELFLFRLDYEDRITSVETGATSPTGRFVVTSENIGRSRVHGAEFGLWAQLSPRLALDATANWTRGEERPGDGTTAPGDRIPPLYGRLALAWDPAGPWRGRAVLQFAAEQDRLGPRDVRDPRIDPNGTDGWTVWHLQAQREVGKRWTVTVGVDNVFDSRYREHGSGIDAPGRGLVFALEAGLP